MKNKSLLVNLLAIIGLIVILVAVIKNNYFKEEIVEEQITYDASFNRIRLFDNNGSIIDTVNIKISGNCDTLFYNSDSERYGGNWNSIIDSCFTDSIGNPILYTQYSEYVFHTTGSNVDSIVMYQAIGANMTVYNE